MWPWYAFHVAVPFAPSADATLHEVDFFSESGNLEFNFKRCHRLVRNQNAVSAEFGSLRIHFLRFEKFEPVKTLLLPVRILFLKDSWNEKLESNENVTKFGRLKKFRPFVNALECSVQRAGLLAVQGSVDQILVCVVVSPTTLPSAHEFQPCKEHRRLPQNPPSRADQAATQYVIGIPHLSLPLLSCCGSGGATQQPTRNFNSIART